MKYYHLTPTANVDSIMREGLREGDGRHWKGQAQRAVYLTDLESLPSWRAELGKKSQESEWTVLEVDVSGVPWAKLKTSRFIREARTPAGFQVAVGIRETSEWVELEDSFTGFPPASLNIVGSFETVCT